MVLEWLVSFLETHPGLIRGLLYGSLGFFILTPILAPAFVIFMPSDALVRKSRSLRDRPMGPAVMFILLRTVRNLVGFGLLVLGVILLFMPGQGLLTMFTGLLLSDLPGRRRLLLRLLGSGRIRPVVDRLRTRYHRPPVSWPDDRT